MMGQPLPRSELVTYLATYRRTAFRLEQQRQYLIESEQKSLRTFLSGQPRPPVEFEPWFALVRGHVDAGRSMGRVRIQEDPPTDYQIWQNWLARWNTGSGEVIRRMTRQKAYEIGLLPAAGEADWWLLDEQLLIMMWFHVDGCPQLYELVDDPTAVAQACAWRDLAVRHSTPDTPKGSGA